MAGLPKAVISRSEELMRKMQKDLSKNLAGRKKEAEIDVDSNDGADSYDDGEYGILRGFYYNREGVPIKSASIRLRGIGRSITDENGMFSIHGAASGEYKISGMKKDFVKLENTQFLFSDRSKIFCCQVESIECAFKSVEQLIIRGEKKMAEELLDNLFYDKRTPQEAVVLTYRFFLTEKAREKRKFASSIRKIGKSGDVDYSKYADMLEDLIEEN